MKHGPHAGYGGQIQYRAGGNILSSEGFLSHVTNDTKNRMAIYGTINYLEKVLWIKRQLRAEVTGFKEEEDHIGREHHTLTDEMKLFLEPMETIRRDGGGILASSLPSLWRRSLEVIMNFFTLDTWRDLVRSYHIAFLNALRHNRSINIRRFLLHSIMKMVEDFK